MAPSKKYLEESIGDSESSSRHINKQGGSKNPFVFLGKRIEGLWQRIRRLKTEDREEADESLTEPVSIPEVIALIHFVAETGLDPDAKFTGPALSAVNRFETESDKKKKQELWVEVLRTYSKLTSLTYPKLQVNGRTVRSTSRVLGSSAGILIWLTIFFALAAATQILSNLFSTLEPPTRDHWFLYSLYYIHHLGLVYLYPAFWGGLGSCIYLTQTIATYAQKSQFDSRKLRGQHSRIILGAILGAVVVHLFFDRVSDLSAGMKSIGPAGVAFLTGLSVKVVYGALRRTISGLNDAIESLGKPKKGQT